MRDKGRGGTGGAVQRMKEKTAGLRGHPATLQDPPLSQDGTTQRSLRKQAASSVCCSSSKQLMLQCEAEVSSEKRLDLTWISGQPIAFAIATRF